MNKAAGWRVAWHISQKNVDYQLLSEAADPHSKQYSNGLFKAGIGHSRAGFIYQFGLPLSWQVWHVFYWISLNLAGTTICTVPPPKKTPVS